MPGRAPAVGVALEGRAVAVVGAELLLGVHAQLDQSRVDGLAAVGLGHDHPVALGPVGVLGIELDVMEVQGGDDLHHRHGAAHVTLTERAELGQAVVGHGLGPGLQFLHEGVAMTTWVVRLLISTFTESVDRGLPQRGQALP